LETTPTSSRLTNDFATSFNGRRPSSNHSDDEVLRLTRLLEERETQLKEQATSLSEMESSLTEIQDMLPGVGAEFPRPRSHGEEPNDISQLRTLLREKTERISMLTAEFDNHRADFRSTIDTLELASTETERVYERKVEELQEELRDMHSRNADVETVADQLKQLEELVHELEEGLEDARRGEAEARGEVEFLRGEVERGRSELRQEREKAAAALKGAGAMADNTGVKEVEQRDDEIRGLKAIIHSLSSGPEAQGRPPLSRQESSIHQEELRTAQANTERLEREKEELRGLVERKAHREEELEREIEQLKSQLGAQVQRGSIISNGMSEHTATQDKRSSERDSKDTILSWGGSQQAARRESPPALPPMAESDTQSSVDDSALWCEICETAGHDILNCSAMAGDAASNRPSTGRSGKDAVIEGLRGLSLSSDRARASGGTPMKSSGNAPTAPLPLPTFDPSLVPPKGTSMPDPDKWCALCESEGHDVTECPSEDPF
jgi:myosin heavy subunit